MDDKERLRDEKIAKDADADPAYFNDQIGEDQEPVKELYDEKGAGWSGKTDRTAKGRN